MMRSIVTVRSNFAGSWAKPGAELHQTSGAMAMPRSAVTTNARESSVAVRSMSERTSSGEVLFFCSASTGTNAWENAPSANSRRSRFGRRKATTNASVARLAPNPRAMMKSRANPRMRLTKVSPLTVTRARRRFMLESRPFRRRKTVHGQHQVRAQARAPGASAPRPQHEPAHRGAHGDQEREKGRRRRGQGRGGERAARVAAGHRPRGRQGRSAPERGRPSQEPAGARAQDPQVAL